MSSNFLIIIKIIFVKEKEVSKEKEIVPVEVLQESIEVRFIREIQEFEANEFTFVNREQVFYIGNPSDNLINIGIPDLPVFLTQAVLKKAVGKAKNKQDAGHELQCKHLHTLVASVQNPVVVIESLTHAGSKVILTEIKDAKRETAIVVIKPNTTVGRTRANVIVSIHTRSNKQLEDLLTMAVHRGEVHYVDMIKIKNWLKQVGKLQLLSKL